MENPSLFGLISLAGNASLGELLARSPVDANTLAKQLTDLVRDGSVELSASDDYTPRHGMLDQVPAFGEVMTLIRKPTRSGLDKMLTTRAGVFTDAIQTALQDDGSAMSIVVSPTSKGFRRRL